MSAVPRREGEEMTLRPAGDAAGERACAELRGGVLGGALSRLGAATAGAEGTEEEEADEEEEGEAAGAADEEEDADEEAAALPAAASVPNSARADRSGRACFAASATSTSSASPPTRRDSWMKIRSGVAAWLRMACGDESRARFRGGVARLSVSIGEKPCSR